MPSNEIKNIKDLIDYSSNKYADNYIYPKEKITYKDFKQEIISIATFLLSNGIENKNIAILSENRYEWEIAFFAIMCSNNIAVPLDKGLTKVEIENSIEKANIELFFCSRKCKEILEDIKKTNNTIKKVICFEEYSSLEKKEELNIEIDNDKTSMIIFTSGTTANAKAVELSNKNICSNLMNSNYYLTNKDICLSVLPLNHVLEGLFCLLNSVYSGAARVFCNDMDEIIDYIKEYKISFIGGVPALFEYLLNYKDELKKEIDHINIFFSGGAALNNSIIREYKKLGIELLQGYGLTECSPVVSLETKENKKEGTVGKVIQNVEVKIINKNENDVGEIIVKGDNITKGYLKDNKLTTNTIIDTYFYTGDLGKIDNDGFLLICGRKKNVIVLNNGKKIFPEEIESLINNIDGVKESIVYSENELKISARIICDKEIIKKDQDRIIDAVKKINANLPIYKRIKDIIITDKELDKTTNGKITRRENNNDHKSELSNLDRLKNVLSNKFNVELLNEETELIKDLGADSLDIVEVFLLIEKEFNIKIEKEDKKRIKTIKDILDIVSKY